MLWENRNQKLKTHNILKDVHVFLFVKFFSFVMFEIKASDT